MRSEARQRLGKFSSLNSCFATLFMVVTIQKWWLKIPLGYLTMPGLCCGSIYQRVSSVAPYEEFFLFYIYVFSLMYLNHEDVFISFFGKGWKERKREGAGRSQSYRVKHTDKEDRWRRKENRDEKRQRTPLLLPSTPPPSASSLSERKSLSVFTCTVVIKAILGLLKLSHKTKLS